MWRRVLERDSELEHREPGLHLMFPADSAELAASWLPPADHTLRGDQLAEQSLPQDPLHPPQPLQAAGQPGPGVGLRDGDGPAGGAQRGR